jgi:serine/threonine protein kinase
MEPRVIAGRYAVQRAVGRGGMGTVWLCRDELLGREVAVKQVGSMPGETSSDVQRALREARSSAALNHPNVVRIFDAVEDGDSNWLVMEYVPSRTLAELLDQEGPISPERAAWIGLQAADGLAAAHARGTMHRDVKPSNILVADNDHVKITDFGIARTHGDAQLTRTGLITGTPAYFAPETARGEDPTMAADVWALGASLYAAVEGNPPYPEQGNALALLTTIATQASPLPRRAGVLTEAINRMMDRDPTARWSMADAAHVLRRIHDQAVADARPAQTAARTTVLPVVGAATGAAASAGAPAGTSAGAVHPAASSPAPPAEPTPTERDRRRPTGLILAAVLLLAALVGIGAVLLTRDDDPPTAADPAGATSSPSTTNTESSTPAETDSASSAPPGPGTQPPEESDGPGKSDKTDKPKKNDPPNGDASLRAVEDFGQRYYALLPGDTEAAYELLSPSYGSSFESYDAFWRTISGVEVRDVAAVDETTVDVSITYVKNGSREDETRRLYLEQEGNSFVIVRDEAV